jgi:predicted nucleic acid-binding protein
MGTQRVNGLTLIDTDILIDAARQAPEAINYLAQIEQQSGLAISVITQMEVIVGCRNKVELRHAERFLQRFRVVKLNEAVCDMTLELVRQYRLSHGLLIPDALIAATALTFNQPLITKNQRDYRFISKLQLLPYPSLTV